MLGVDVLPGRAMAFTDVAHGRGDHAGPRRDHSLGDRRGEDAIELVGVEGEGCAAKGAGPRGIRPATTHDSVGRPQVRGGTGVTAGPSGSTARCHTIGHQPAHQLQALQVHGRVAAVLPGRAPVRAQPVAPVPRPQRGDRDAQVAGRLAGAAAGVLEHLLTSPESVRAALSAARAAARPEDHVRAAGQPSAGASCCDLRCPPS